MQYIAKIVIELHEESRKNKSTLTWLLRKLIKGAAQQTEKPTSIDTDGFNILMIYEISAQNQFDASVKMDENIKWLDYPQLKIADDEEASIVETSVKEAPEK